MPLFVRSEAQVADAEYPLVTDPDAYEVYVTVLKSLTLRMPNEHLLVIVSETTARVGCCEAASTTTEWNDSLANFIDLNKHTWKLQSQLIPKQYQLVSERDLNSMFRMPPKSAGYQKQREATIAGWSQFRTQFPESGGFLRLSTVGFDTTRNRAIVYVESVCGYQCGHGGLHYLERDAKGWHEAKSGGPWCAWIA